MARQALVRIALALAVVFVVALGAIIVFSDSAAPQTRSCAPASMYGTQCVTVLANGLRVTAIQAQYSAVVDFFGQDRWTFETTTYRCDPRGRPKSRCTPDTTAYGPVHRPKSQTDAATICNSSSSHLGGEGCSVSVPLAVPRAFTEARWLCVEVAVRVQGKWVDNGAGLSAGDRSCRHVH